MSMVTQLSMLVDGVKIKLGRGGWVFFNLGDAEKKECFLWDQLPYGPQHEDGLVWNCLQIAHMTKH